MLTRQPTFSIKILSMGSGHELSNYLRPFPDNYTCHDSCRRGHRTAVAMDSLFILVFLVQILCCLYVSLHGHKIIAWPSVDQVLIGNSDGFSLSFTTQKSTLICIVWNWKYWCLTFSISKLQFHFRLWIKWLLNRALDVLTQLFLILACVTNGSLSPKSSIRVLYVCLNWYLNELKIDNLSSYHQGNSIKTDESIHDFLGMSVLQKGIVIWLWFLIE